MKYQIEETNEFSSLKKLYFDCGLEGAMEKDFTGKKVIHWKCTFDGQIIGGATLRIEKTDCVLEFLAVKENYRNLNIGRTLLETIQTYVNDIQVSTIILCAKEPLFYNLVSEKTHGFNRVDDSEYFSFLGRRRREKAPTYMV